jgi:N-carbamoyl-L-amino-acid hydrolase
MTADRSGGFRVPDKPRETTLMKDVHSNRRVDGDRLWQSLMEMAQIGPGLRGGNNRQTLTDADRQGRDLFRRWCEEAGMTVGVDSMGNMFARHEGAEPDLDPVMTGSHLDTQPTGGKYDGVLGVLAGLELIRSIRDQGIRTRRPIVVVNWTNEEGTRFAPAMLSSGVFAGVHTQDWAYGRKDAEGREFGAELARIGYKGDEPVGQRRIHALFELHIEQGPILEAEGKDIGIVTHGQGLNWLQVTLTGQEAHTGSTPMPMRRNAGLGMARITELVHQIAMSHQPDAVGAIGHCDVHPNSRNIVPGKVVFTIDFRSPSFDTQTEMERRLREGAEGIARELGLGLEIEQVGHFDPVTFDPACVDMLRRAADDLGYSHRDIISGAGHDACWINRVAPTAMVMCPCVDGLSHNEDEEISREWASAGADVLLHAVLESAEIVE